MKHSIHILCLAVPLAVCMAPNAESRPLTRAMRCAEAQTLVAKQGAAVLDTDKFIYDRYVRDARFCPPRQTTEPAWVPTRDNPECFIGYTCVEPDPDVWWR